MARFTFLLVSLILWSYTFADEQPNPFLLPSVAQLKEAANLKLEPPSVELPNAQLFARRVNEMNKRLRPIDYDLDLRAKELPAGVEPAFKYVRDQIRFEAYPGVFRGARGTYLSKAGNAADRALLLAQLLKAKGIETRFALGRLSPQDATLLFNRMFETAATKTSTDNATPGQSAQFVRHVILRATRDYSAIISALGTKLPTKAAVEQSQIISEVSNHVWVQAKSGEQWIDLDTSFADAVPGKAHCPAERTVSELPAELHQLVTFRIIAQELDGAALKQETAMELTRPVVDLLERQVFLFHAPRSGIAAAGAAMSGEKDKWTPVLWIDGEMTFGKPIAFIDSTEKPGGAVGAAIDALDSEPKAQSGPQLVSEVLEIELKLPGGNGEIEKRILCDRGGAAWRSAPPDSKTLAPFERDERGPVLAQTIHNIWLSAGRHDLAAYADALRMLSEATRSSNGNLDPQASFAEQVWPVALNNLAFVLWGDHSFAPALNDDQGVRCYLDSPRVLLFSMSVHKDQSIEFDTDLRRDRFRAVARDATSSAAAAQRKIWYGALEGALEHEMIALQAAVMSEQPQVASTSALLNPQGVTCLGPGAGVTQLEASNENRARVAIALARGHTLIIPNGALKAADAGWWEITGTGDVRAVWGDDLNGGRTNIGGGYVRQSPGMYGGSSGPNVHYVDPKTGRSYTPKKGGPSGSEYATIIETVSLPGGITIRKSVAVAVAAAVAAAADILYEILK